MSVYIPRFGCAQCMRSDHHLCTGFDGPMTTHPDSLPLCWCNQRDHRKPVDSGSGNTVAET